MLYENVCSIIVVGVGIETNFLGRNQGGQDVAAVVEDGIGSNSTEIAALGLQELCVDGIQDGVGCHTIEVSAGACQSIGQGVAVSLDTDIFPCACAFGILTKTDDQVSDQTQSLGLGICSMLQTCYEVFCGNSIIFFTLAGGPYGVVTNGECPFGSIIVVRPVGCHAFDQVAVAVLCQQTFDEVRGIVAVGGLVVIDIVQSGDVEVVDHGIGIGTVVIHDLSLSLGSTFFSGSLFSFSCGLLSRSGRSAAAAACKQTCAHRGSQQRCQKFS